MEQADNYLLMFADLVGSTDVAVEASPTLYSRNYVASFHYSARRAYDFVTLKRKVFTGAKFKKAIDPPHVAGDEVLSFSALPKEPEQQEDMVASAVAFAYAIKLLWLASPYNLERIKSKQFPRDVSVGIHIGPAVEVPCPKGDNQVASLHINLAKRIETSAKEGKDSRIFASYEVSELFHSWIRRHQNRRLQHKPPLLCTAFKKRDNPHLVKGVPKPLSLFELVWDRAKKTELNGLIEEAYQSPLTKDADIEDATKTLMEIFLPPSVQPFVGDRGVEVETTYHTTSAYIKNWFDGIRSVSRLFFDEPWLVLSSYWVSCGLLRHSDVKAAGSTQQRYVEIAKIARKRLRALWEDAIDDG